MSNNRRQPAPHHQLQSKQVPTDVDLPELRDKLHEMGVKPEALHRKLTPQFQSTLIKFKVSDDMRQRVLQKINTDMLDAPALNVQEGHLQTLYKYFSRKTTNLNLTKNIKDK